MSAGRETANSLENRAIEWLENVRQQGRSPHTVSTYAAALLNLRRYLSTEDIGSVHEAEAAHLIGWQKHLVSSGCAVATQDQFTRIVRFWFRWMHKRGILFDDPTVDLRSPKVPQTLARCPSEEQMQRLLRSVRGQSAIAMRDAALLELAYASGARLGELASLKISAVNLVQHLVLLEGKGRRQRVVPLTRKAARALRRYLRKGRPRLVSEAVATEALFVSSRDGSPLNRPGIASVVRSAGAKAGISLTPHDIRRAFATHMLRGGANPAAIRELLGHASFRHLARYLRLRLELPESPAYRRRFH